jgi:hypothetical protein
VVKALLAVACSLAIVACAAAPQKSAAPATAAPEPTTGAMMPDDPRKQIQDMYDKITSDRTVLSLAEPDDEMVQGAPAQPMGALPSTNDPKCRPAPTDTCKTSCTLSDSICSNADKICRLAQDMAGDGWAQNKCAKANKTCEASRTKCCGCQ